MFVAETSWRQISSAYFGWIFGCCLYFCVAYSWDIWRAYIIKYATGMATFKLYCVLVFHHVCLKASTLGRWQNHSHAKTQSYVNSFTWRRVDIQRLCQRPTIRSGTRKTFRNTSKVDEWKKCRGKQHEQWTKNLVVLRYIGIILPNYVGILINHYKDPYWNNQYFMKWLIVASLRQLYGALCWAVPAYLGNPSNAGVFGSEVSPKCPERFRCRNYLVDVPVGFVRIKGDRINGWK